MRACLEAMSWALAALRRADACRVRIRCAERALAAIRCAPVAGARRHAGRERVGRRRQGARLAVGGPRSTRASIAAVGSAPSTSVTGPGTPRTPIRSVQVASHTSAPSGRTIDLRPPGQHRAELDVPGRARVTGGGVGAGRGAPRASGPPALGRRDAPPGPVTAVNSPPGTAHRPGRSARRRRSWSSVPSGRGGDLGQVPERPLGRDREHGGAGGRRPMRVPGRTAVIDRQDATDRAPPPSWGRRGGRERGRRVGSDRGHACAGTDGTGGVGGRARLLAAGRRLGRGQRGRRDGDPATLRWTPA